MHWSEHKAIEPTATALTWLFSLLVAYQGAQLTWLIIDNPVLVLPEPSQGPASHQVIQDDVDLGALNLFGKADEVEQVPTQSIDAPKTRLRLVLMGVFVAANAQDSSAIIAEQGREGEFFKVGDRVQGRARLSQVFEEKVILDNSGKLETLTFEEAAKLMKGITSQKNTFKKPDIKKALSKVNRKTQKNAFKRQLSKIKTPEQFVDLAKEQLEDPTTALSNLGLTATGDGYKLSNSSSMLKSIGMKAGDKIISINGYALGDPEQDKTIIDEVYASGNASIVIERGSRRMTINHTF